MKWAEFSERHRNKTCSWQGQLGSLKKFQVDATMLSHQNMMCARLIKQAAGLLRTRFIPQEVGRGRPRGGGYNRWAWIDSSICIYSMELVASRSEPSFFVVALCFVLMLCAHAWCFVLFAPCSCFLLIELTAHKIGSFCRARLSIKHKAWAQSSQFWPKDVILSTEHEARSTKNKAWAESSDKKPGLRGRFFCREPAKLRSRQGWTLTLMITTGQGSGHGSGSGTAQGELWLKNRPLLLFRRRNFRVRVRKTYHRYLLGLGSDSE
jgi:hypothetical protein